MTKNIFNNQKTDYNFELTLYVKDYCGFCGIIKKKLDEWEIPYKTINVQKDHVALDFMKQQKHGAVPQLYYNDIHINDIQTKDMTLDYVLNKVK